MLGRKVIKYLKCYFYMRNFGEYGGTYEGFKSNPVGKWKKMGLDNVEDIGYLCKYEPDRAVVINTSPSKDGSTIVLDMGAKELDEGGVHLNIERIWTFTNGEFNLESIDETQRGRHRESLVELMRKNKKIFERFNDPLVRVSIAEAYKLAFS